MLLGKFKLNNASIFPSGRQELIERIKFHAQRSSDAKQIANRLKKLTPGSLERTEIELEAMYHRIQYETHLMMYEARITLDSFNRSLVRNGKNDGVNFKKPSSLC